MGRKLFITLSLALSFVCALSAFACDGDGGTDTKTDGVYAERAQATVEAAFDRTYQAVNKTNPNIKVTATETVGGSVTVYTFICKGNIGKITKWVPSEGPYYQDAYAQLENGVIYRYVQELGIWFKQRYGEINVDTAKGIGQIATFDRIDMGDIRFFEYFNYEEGGITDQKYALRKDLLAAYKTTAGNAGIANVYFRFDFWNLRMNEIYVEKDGMESKLVRFEYGGQDITLPEGYVTV